ncbi:hypothetical protein [Tardiphaga sp.]|jgi:hypothetical protein|uniref:hypothetical protein n=1 Tax=Tardiphaga sp. TaxID=1926292 RepID=UPI0037DA6B7A
MTLQPFSPDLAFLGNRDYLHGSTLFEVMIDKLHHAKIAAVDLDFVFERRSDRQVMVVPGESNSSAAKIASLRYDGGILTALETEERIRRRQQYVETDMAKAFVSEGDNTIHVEHSGAANSFLEVATFAFKTIIQRREPERKVVFARLRIPAIPVGAFSVTFGRKIGNRFYEGRVEAPRQDAGLIYFGAWS